MATADQYMDLIVIYLAGLAAEIVVFGNHSSGAGDQQADLSLATDLATMMEQSFGFGQGWLTDTGTGSICFGVEY